MDHNLLTLLDLTNIIFFKSEGMSLCLPKSSCSRFLAALRFFQQHSNYPCLLVQYSTYLSKIVIYCPNYFSYEDHEVLSWSFHDLTFTEREIR